MNILHQLYMYTVYTYVLLNMNSRDDRRLIHKIPVLIKKNIFLYVLREFSNDIQLSLYAIVATKYIIFYDFMKENYI